MKSRKESGSLPRPADIRTAFVLLFCLAVGNADSKDLALKRIQRFPRIDISSLHARIAVLGNSPNSLYLGIVSDGDPYAWEHLCRWSIEINHEFDSVGLYDDDCCDSDPTGRSRLNDHIDFRAVIDAIHSDSLRPKCRQELRPEDGDNHLCADSTLKSVKGFCLVYPENPAKIVVVPPGRYNMKVSFSVDSMNAFMTDELKAIPDSFLNRADYSYYHITNPDTLWYGKLAKEFSLICGKDGIEFKPK